MKFTDRIDVPDCLRPLQDSAEKMSAGELISVDFKNSLYHTHFLDFVCGDADPGSLRGINMTPQDMARVMLDLGVFPYALEAERGTEPDPQLFNKLIPFFEESKHMARIAREQLSIVRFKMTGRKMPPVNREGFPGLAFAVCQSGHPRKMRRNLGRSEWWNPWNSWDNETYVHPAPSTGPKDAIDMARETSKPIIVYCHQDIFLPKDWDVRFWNQWKKAEDRGAKVGMAGLFGLTGNRLDGTRTEFGRVVDFMGMRSLEPNAHALPAIVSTVDEMLVAIPSDGVNPDPALGWHFHAADMAISTRLERRDVVSLDAPVLHNSAMFPDIKPADYGDYEESEKLFKDKWPGELPFEVPCGVVTKSEDK